MVALKIDYTNERVVGGTTPDRPSALTSYLKPYLHIFTYFILLTSYFLSSASAAELTARQLQEYCNEMEKSLLGQVYDPEKVTTCKGYLMGFFDSMMLTNQILGKEQFCIPKTLPKTQNNVILNAWVQKNPKLADTTTATVALYAAYKVAFPCK